MFTVFRYLRFLITALIFTIGIYLRLLKIRLILLTMVEPLLSGIVFALVPVTIAGLFVTAFLQFRRSDQLSILEQI
jgi:cytochrome b6-f complex subunit 5